MDLRTYRPAPDLLRDRVILVTGAGQGIGRAAALAFAAHGATVILHGRRVPKLERVYDEIEAAGGPQPVIFPLDLEKAADKDFEDWAEGLRHQFGRLDGILHNAPFGFTPAPLTSQKLDQWVALLRVDLIAPFALTRACFPLLQAAPDASVIMTSETHGHRPAAYWGALAAGRAGVEALVKVQADEWEMYPQLRVNAVIPGPVLAPQRRRTHPGERGELLAPAESLTAWYLWLMGPDSRGTTGQVIECAPEAPVAPLPVPPAP